MAEDNSHSSQNRNYIYPNQLNELSNAVSSLSKLLLESGKTLSVLRRELKGESLYQLEDGNSVWIQVSKPMFVKVNPATDEPLKIRITLPDKTEKEIYVPNDEAVEEILSILSSMGINTITPLTNLKEDIILDDLKIFECKLAAVLCLKQKQWGIDKEMLPMIQTKLATMIQDARYQAREGLILKALQTTVQRVEQAFEGQKPQTKLPSPSPYT